MSRSYGPKREARRGALLLLVLISLTFFLMLGTLMLVIATRSRTSARAFSDAAISLSSGSIQARGILDEALMALLRGTRDPSGVLGEPLLEDKYGAATLSGSTARLTGDVNRDPVLLVDIVGGLTSATTASGTNPSQFAGRILTVLPNAGEGNPASFRIIGSNTASTPTLLVSNVPFRSGMRFVSGSTYRVRINGREFTRTTGTSGPESYDGYDDANAWLAQPVLTAGGTVAYRRMTYLASGTSPVPEVDNDNDGILDGVWISATTASGTTRFLQSRPSSLGGTLTYRVSYLVLDLDGRININAAGTRPPPPPQATLTGTYWSVPLGMGYGPADIDGSLVIGGTSPPAGGPSSFGTPGTDPAASPWGRMMVGGAPPPQTSGSNSQRRPPPGVGWTDGRYGPNQVAGRAGDDTVGNQITSQTGYGWVISGTLGNAVTDLKSRRAVYVTSTSGQVTPVLTFECPEPSPDFEDDPYESRFDVYAKRSAATRTTAPGVPNDDDNPYGLADLERILRANDADATTLPPRLAALLEDRAQGVRMSITTDSWDAPALTGSAAMQLDMQRTGTAILPPQYPWQPTATSTNCWSPDVAAGLKFDLNRVVSNPTQAAEYCRGLYTLALLLGETDQQRAAQWAVNVLDFRDEDSTMTRFPYDTDLSNGWQTSGSSSPVVYGVERPDLLLAETAGWKQQTGPAGQVFINLFCPEWNAVDTASGRSERRDTNLGNVNRLSLVRSGTIPIWQVRFDDDKVVQFQPVTGPFQQSQFVLTGTGMATITTNIHGSTSGTATIDSGTNLCLQPPTPQNFSVSGPATLTIDQGGAFQRSSPGLFKVWLERLADPAQPNSITNPYVRVDTADLNVIMVPDLGPPPEFKTEVRRETSADLASFWRSVFDPGDDSQIATTAATLGISGSSRTKVAPWFHWPNRPFISHAELSLVPADSPVLHLQNHAVPGSSLVLGAAVGQLLLDSTHVPSRFAENTVYMPAGAPWVSESGFDALGSNTFSKWREPGRVNVNTIVSASTPAMSPPTDSLVWYALVGGTQVRLSDSRVVSENPFVSGTQVSTPAQSIAHLLTLTAVQTGTNTIATLQTSGTGTGPRDKNPAFAYALANRLANTATVRSNMFAVWITLEINDDSPAAPTRRYRRMFAIIDRSIPVGSSRGEDLNVRDTIRVQRFLE
jgi:hypothetical protein